MPVVFAQGMRRSGTTILFDLFWDDARFDCWYEPLNVIRPARGGGSKARDVDYGAKVAAFKRRFLARRPRGAPPLAEDDLCWGAPLRPEVEFDPRWPPHVRAFVAALSGTSRDVFVKFTRASHKLADLSEIAPGSFFLHLVRDPRSVATSHLFRTAPEVRDRIVADGSFFTMATGFDQWKAERMAGHLVATRPEYAPFAAEPAFVKVMLVWKELFVAAEEGARRHFAGRSLTLWHDDLCRDPEGALSRVFGLWGAEPRPEVLAWARANVRPPKPWHEPGNPAWQDAMDRLGVTPLLPAQP